MAEELGAEQLALDLLADLDPETSRLNYKLKQAEKLASKIAMNLTEFDRKVQAVIFPKKGFKEIPIWSDATSQELTKKELIKLHICLFLTRLNRPVTIAELCRSLGSLIEGEKAMRVSPNCIVWNKISSDGIEAINELETDRWIDTYEISSIQFIKNSNCLDSPLIRLPSVLPGSVSKKGYQEPHWLPVQIEPGLRLLAVQLLEDILETSPPEGSQNLSTKIDVDDLETDKFSNAEEIIDSRKRILQLIVQRQGQPEFRGKLIEAYDGKCAITGFDVKESLEAAHIVPYLGADTNHLSNGLLLRADLHTLFDLFLFTIDPQSLVVLLSPDLEKTCYVDLGRKKIRERIPGFPTLSKGALKYHFDHCEWVRE